MKDNLLKANVQALQLKNPGLADALAQHVVSESNLQFAETKDGVPTVRYRHWNGDREVNTWLHSRYHPIQEAERFAANQTASLHTASSIGPLNIVLYGFGLGYHVSAMIETMGPSDTLCILESNLDLLKTAFSLSDFSQLMEIPQLQFMNDLAPLDALNFLKSAQQRGDQLTIYRPAVNCLSDKFADLKLFLTNQLIPGQNTNRQKIAAANHYANLKVPSQPIQTLFSTHEKETAFIVSSGPSLNTFWESIKLFRNAARVICVGSALRFIVSKEIIPDYIVVMDALASVRKQLEGCEQLQSPLLFSNFANADAIQSYQGAKYMYLCEPVAGFSDAQVISTGGSVATAALDIALKMGITKVIFVGQDLCWAGGHHHVTGDLHGPDTRIRDFGVNLRKKNIKGNWVSTQPRLLNYRQWFEKTIATHTDVQFFNLADEGLSIDGASVISPSQLNQIING